MVNRDWRTTSIVLSLIQSTFLIQHKLNSVWCSWIWRWGKGTSRLSSPDDRPGKRSNYRFHFCWTNRLPYNKVGQAALKGKEQKIKIEYKHWNVLGNNFTNQFHIVAVKHSVLFLRKTSHIFSVHSSSPKSTQLKFLTSLHNSYQSRYTPLEQYNLKPSKASKCLKSAGSSQLLIRIGQVDRLSTESMIISWITCSLTLYDTLVN